MAIRATISIQRIQAQTANEIVQAQTVYQSVVASEISVNPDSKNLMLFDSVPLSEVVFKVITKGLADSTAVTDLYASHFNKGTIAESVSVADTFSKVVTYNRIFSDAFTLDDLAQIDKDFYGNKGNIFAFTDIIGLTNNKNLTDSYTVSDVITKVVAYVRSFTDSTTLSDSEYYSLAKSTSDPLTLSDSQLKGFTTQKTDSFTVADAADKSSGLAKTDSFSFADSSYFSASKETSDSVSLADSHYRALTKIIADAFTLDDSALINKNYYGNKGNVCTISDLIAFTLVYSRSYTDSFSFSDTTITELSKVINDVVTMTDSTVVERGKDATDVLGFVELMASTVDKVLSDQATLSDSLSSLVGKGIVDSVSFNDSTVSEITKVITDAFALDDSALVNKDYFGSKGNVCTLSDVISFAFIWNRTFAHSFSFSDVVTLTTISGKVLNGAQLNRITLN